MVSNQHITAPDVSLQRQTASDDNRGNESGIYDTEPPAKDRVLLKSVLGAFRHLMATGEMKVPFMTLT